MVNDYWKKRIEAEQNAKIDRDRSLADEMDRLYRHHFLELEKEIRAFEQRYASKNNLPLSEVKARVDEMDVKAFEERAKRYVAEKNFSAKANAELALYNLKMKMNRLELLQYQLDLEMVAMSNAEHKLTERFLNDEYINTLKSQSGLLGRSVLSSSQIEKVAQTVLNTPFKGAVWSDRVWERQEALRTIVAQMTEDYLLKGKNPTTMISKLRKEFGVSASEAKRLAVTEGARVATEAERQSYLSNGYEEYEFIAEPKACDICKPLDGKIFKVKDIAPGLNASPMHPHCRCATAAHYSGGGSETVKYNIKDMFSDVESMWKQISNGELSKSDILPKLKERYYLGSLPKNVAELVHSKLVYIDSGSLASSLERHGTQYKLEEFKLIEEIVKNPYLVLDNSDRVKDSLLLYAKIPDKDKVMMEAVAIPDDNMLMIHFNKVGIRQEKKNRKSKQILYNKREK